ncbi:MAG: hypothetical protein ACHQAY_26580 [Hyphomicrobiales bacterium]
MQELCHTSATSEGGRNGRATLAKAKEIVDGAPRICPYSKATRGNIPVTLEVI